MGNNFIHQNRANSPNNLSPLKKTVGFLCWSSLQNFTKTIEHRREKNNHNVSSGRHHNHPQEESSAPPILCSSLHVRPPQSCISHNVNARWVTWWDPPLGQKCVCVCQGDSDSDILAIVVILPAPASPRAIPCLLPPHPWLRFGGRGRVRPIRRREAHHLVIPDLSRTSMAYLGDHRRHEHGRKEEEEEDDEGDNDNDDGGNRWGRDDCDSSSFLRLATTTTTDAARGKGRTSPTQNWTTQTRRWWATWGWRWGGGG